MKRTRIAARSYDAAAPVRSTPALAAVTAVTALALALDARTSEAQSLGGLRPWDTVTPTAAPAPREQSPAQAPTAATPGETAVTTAAAQRASNTATTNATAAGSATASATPNTTDTRASDRGVSPRAGASSRGQSASRGRSRSANAPSNVPAPTPTLVLAPLRVTAHVDDDQPIVIEMFAPPGVTPYAAPYALRPFGPPPRPLRLIASYDGDDARVSVTVAPGLTIMRSYDGEPATAPEVRVECIATPPDAVTVLLPLRVTAGTNW